VLATSLLFVAVWAVLFARIRREARSADADAARTEAGQVLGL
jgi:hypothetical protein